MDVWLKPDNENKMRVIAALRKNDIYSEDLEEMEKIDFTSTIAFSAWDNPFKIDFLTKVSGVTFDEADEQKILADIDGITIPIINVNHLVLSKMATGRLQDKADIEKLQQIQKKQSQ